MDKMFLIIEESVSNSDYSDYSDHSDYSTRNLFLVESNELADRIVAALNATTKAFKEFVKTRLEQFEKDFRTNNSFPVQPVQKKIPKRPKCPYNGLSSEEKKAHPQRDQYLKENKEWVKTCDKIRYDNNITQYSWRKKCHKKLEEEKSKFINNEFLSNLFNDFEVKFKLEMMKIIVTHPHSDSTYSVEELTVL